MAVSESNWSELEVKKVMGKTALTTSLVHKPLKVFAMQHASACQVVFSNYGGGFVDGDQIALNIVCGEDSQTVFSSQANSRVYKSDTGKVARHSLNAQIKRDALAIYWGDPIVPQADSIFEQKFHWKLEEGAVLLMADWFEAGRILNEERFQFGSFFTEFKVTNETRTLVWDRFRIDPSKTNVNSPGAFLDHHSYLNLFLVGHENIDRIKLLETHLRFVAKKHFQADKPLNMKEFPLIGSVSKVNEYVFVVRCSAKDHEAIHHFVKELSTVFQNKDLLGFNPLERKF
jgi:urease accessory protein